MEIQLSMLYTVPSSSTASWHGLYKPLDLYEGEGRVKLQSYLLFYNTLYSNTRARILGVTFNDGISCKYSMEWKIDLGLNNRLVTAKQIGIDSSGLSHLVDPL